MGLRNFPVFPIWIFLIKNPRCKIKTPGALADVHTNFAAQRSKNGARFQWRLRSEDENAVLGTKKNVPALATLIANFDFEHEVPRGVPSAVGAVDVACIVQVHSAALHAFFRCRFFMPVINRQLNSI